MASQPLRRSRSQRLVTRVTDSNPVSPKPDELGIRRSQSSRVFVPPPPIDTGGGASSPAGSVQQPALTTSISIGQLDDFVLQSSGATRGSPNVPALTSFMLPDAAGTRKKQRSVRMASTTPTPRECSTRSISPQAAILRNIEASGGPLDEPMSPATAQLQSLLRSNSTAGPASPVLLSMSSPSSPTTNNFLLASGSLTAGHRPSVRWPATVMDNASPGAERLSPGRTNAATAQPAASPVGPEPTDSAVFQYIDHSDDSDVDAYDAVADLLTPSNPDDNDDGHRDELLSSRDMLSSGDEPHEEPVSPKGTFGVPMTKRARAAAAERLASKVETLAQRSERKHVCLRFFDVAAVTLLIVLFVLYPAILEVSGNLLVCEDIDYGPGRASGSVLVADRSIDCHSDEYETLYRLAFAHLVGYGVGLPLLIVGLVKLASVLSFGGSDSDAKLLFFFMTGGFNPGQWFWESLILARKAAVVMVGVMITDNRMRVYAGMWTIAFAFALNSAVEPYSNPVLKRLEVVSLASILVTLNLSLLFDYWTSDGAPGAHWAVVIAIFAVNVAALLMFVYGLAAAMQEKLLKFAAGNERLKRLLERWFDEDDGGEVEAVYETIESEYDELQRHLRAVAPRTSAIDALLLTRPAAWPLGNEPATLLQSYRDRLQTASVRLTRMPQPTDELQHIYMMELEILRAELACVRASKASAEARRVLGATRHEW